MGVPGARQETSRLDVELEPGSVFRLGVLSSGGVPVPGPGFAEETVIEIGYDAGNGGFSQPYLRLDRSRTILDLSMDADHNSGPGLPDPRRRSGQPAGAGRLADGGSLRRSPTAVPLT